MDNSHFATIVANSVPLPAAPKPQPSEAKLKRLARQRERYGKILELRKKRVQQETKKAARMIDPGLDHEGIFHSMLTLKIDSCTCAKICDPARDGRRPGT